MYFTTFLLQLLFLTEYWRLNTETLAMYCHQPPVAVSLKLKPVDLSSLWKMQLCSYVCCYSYIDNVNLLTQHA